MPNYTNNILLTGYWPPTNNMLRQFSPFRWKNPWGWRGGNWRGHGFDIYAFFPEFRKPDRLVGGKDPGFGDFKVTYRDTKEDWERITQWLRPCAIITFSRGFSNNSWEIEEKVHNLEEWEEDANGEQPEHTPPDDSYDTDGARSSTLPKEDILTRLIYPYHVPVSPDINSEGAGDFLSNYIGYLGAWYQDEHSSRDADGMCFAAGHIHVGGLVSDSVAEAATEITLEALIDDIKPKRPTTWISEIIFRVQTADAPNAGTDDMLTVEFLRDGEHLFTGLLDDPGEDPLTSLLADPVDDHERGDFGHYKFEVSGRHFDESWPHPHLIYPDAGIEFSDGIAGNLTCRLRIHGDDKWIKDRVDVWVKEVRRATTSRGRRAWVEEDMYHLCSWTQDVTLSTYSDEGYEVWDLLY